MNKSERKNSNVVIERKKFSANWEAFLQNQDHAVQRADPKPRYNKELNSHLRHQTKNKFPIKNNTISKNDSNSDVQKHIESKPKNGAPILTQYIGMDCEMVGIGSNGRDNMLARVSLVNKFGDCIYDKFVQPREKVTDYRTPVSGVREEDLKKGECFEVVQKEVATILKGRYLVGHSLKNDLEVLYFSHPFSKIRDTSRYYPFKMLSKGRTPSLKLLSKEVLGVDIQSGEHSSVEDARAAMQLYSLHSRQWESSIKTRRRPHIKHDK